MSVWGDIWTNIETIAGIATGNQNLEADIGQTPEGQAAIQGAGFFGTVEGFLLALADPGMWVSLGWLVLGIVLIFLGLRLWTGKLTPAGVPGPAGLI